MKNLSLSLGLLTAACSTAGGSKAPTTPPFTPPKGNPSQEASINDLILDIIESEMPREGRYSVKPDGFKALKDSVQSSSEHSLLKVFPEKIRPSFCSSSTYVIWTRLLEKLNHSGRAPIDSTLTQTLLPTKSNGSGYDDGEGVWGRWNANGPGTARLFFEAGIGKNFVDPTYKKALPGDFLKIFWNLEVGKNESGHSVVFTGVQKDTSGRVTQVCYFSSQGGTNGLGHQCVEASRVKFAIFSRFEKLSALAELNRIPAVDPYLASLLTKSSTFQEACAKCGIAPQDCPTPK